MRYQLVRELTADSLLVKTETGTECVFDKVALPANLKESYRLELHNKIRELSKNEAGVNASGLIKYHGLEKYNEEYYLRRKEPNDKGIVPYRPVDLAEAIAVLLQIVRIMDAYHRRNVVIGGLSLGQLHCGATGELLLQDPPLLNYLSKMLGEKYGFSLPSEVIKGAPWNQQADVFSWGELAYRLLVGVAPFAAAKPEDQAAKVLEGMVIDPRNMQPRLSAKLSRLILDCLAVTPQKRPDTVNLLQRLEEMAGREECLADPETLAVFQEKAAVYRKQQQSRERLRLWWRKYGISSCVALAVVIVLAAMLFSPKKSILTPRTTPLAVLYYYFKGITTVDVTMIDDTVYRAKNDLSEVVGNIHVINVTQKANQVAMSGDAAIKIKVEGLKIKKESETTGLVVYNVRYNVEFDMRKERQYLARHDRFSLSRVYKVWRITKIKKLQEKRWSEKITPAEPKTN
jgi:hypothetical protein